MDEPLFDLAVVVDDAFGLLEVEPVAALVVDDDDAGLAEIDPVPGFTDGLLDVDPAFLVVVDFIDFLVVDDFIDFFVVVDFVDFLVVDDLTIFLVVEEFSGRFVVLVLEVANLPKADNLDGPLWIPQSGNRRGLGNSDNHALFFDPG